MIHENVILDEYIDIEEALSTFIAEKSLNPASFILDTHSVKRVLEKMHSTKFNYLSWQTLDILDEACSNYITVNKKLVNCIDTIFKRWPIHTEVAKYLVINSVPEHVYRKLRLYVVANSEEAKAILTMGGL